MIENSEPKPRFRGAPDMASRGTIHACDHDWQFPAVTERHAFHRLREAGAIPEGVTYIAYPWATLIDKIQANAPDAPFHLEKFRDFRRGIPEGTTRVTVCQHVLLKDYLSLFAECGLSEIFWPHVTRADLAANLRDGISLHPFPLYPVQVTGMAPPDEAASRPHLFSFIGARSDRYYLTRAREWIIDLLAGHPRGLVVGRDRWHYHAVVYDHQIRPRHGWSTDAATFIDQSASERFRASLARSVFALCPSGSGPNSIRLYETLGSGAIPVILADTYAPPGDRALWEAAAVFCGETREEIEALPARLEAIARDPGRLAAMRHACRQLWMLYGPECFVYDIQRWMLDHAAPPAGRDPPEGAGRVPFRTTLIAGLAARETMEEAEALQLLHICTGNLLLEGRGVLAELGGGEAARMIARARKTLPAGHPAVADHDRIVERLRSGPAVAAPRIDRARPRKICFLGRHAHRTPLGYAPLRALAADRMEEVGDPAHADMIMTGFNIDLPEKGEAIAAARAANPALRVVVISEEPLWDSVWSGGFAERNRVVRCGRTDIPYTFLNHANSGIFDFRKIPYFLLTDAKFPARYGLLIARHAPLAPRTLLERWRAAPLGAAFFLEARDGEDYARSFPEQAVRGLSAYRTQVARQVDLSEVLRVGKGWQDHPPRQDLPDWHLDKLATLDGRVRIVSSYENTHQRAYVSEKIFDAFATGGVPTYYADAGHRVRDLVPEACMINTFGQSAGEAAARIAAFAPDMAFAEAWIETARALRERFTDAGAIRAERRRVVDRLFEELETVEQGEARPGR